MDPTTLELGLPDAHVQPISMDQQLESFNRLTELVDGIHDSSDQLGQSERISPTTQQAAAPSFAFQQLGAQQQEAITGIRNIINTRRMATSQDAAPLIIVLSGGPGTGKTTSCAVLLKMLQDDGLNVQATATTHAAKHRLGPTAKTLHKLLGLKPGAMLSALTTTNKIAQQLDPLDIIVTDEFTMLTAHTLCLGAYRLRNCTKPGTPRKVTMFLVQL
jgi:ATP-dependent exoDNAse (exonuclease V) alpha subunit